MRYQRLFTLVFFLLSEGSVLAHGEFPAFFDAITPVQSSNNDLIFVSTFGWVRFDGTGSNNSLVCDEMYDSDPYPTLFSLSGDVFLVGHFKGIHRITEGGCTTESLKINGEERFVRGFASDKEGSIYLATSTGNVTNDVYKSVDEGKTWAPMEAPLADIYYTSIHSIQSGPYSMLVMGFHSETRVSVALWWGAEVGWNTQSFPLFLMEELGQPLIYQCDEGVTRCLVGWSSDPENRVYLLQDNTEDPVPVFTSVSAAIRDAVFAPGGAMLVATVDTLMRSGDEGISWEALSDLPPPRCIARIGDTLYTCANPYLENSFAVASSQDDGVNWEPLISGFNEVHMLYPCAENTAMPALCEKPWESLSVEFGVETESENGESGDTSSSGVESAEEGSAPEEKPGNAGCAISPHGEKPPLLLILLVLLGPLVFCKPRLLLLLVSLFVFGCGTFEDTGNHNEDAEEEASDGSETTKDAGEEIDTSEALPPYRGTVAIGAFEQMGNSGVILNAFFAQTDLLDAPFDEDHGACKIRYIDVENPPLEPVGVSAGILSVSGDGLVQEISFIPYDFGEEQGGVAYDHGLGNDVSTLLEDEGEITISIAGEEDIPPLSGTLSTPPALPEITPPISAFPADAEDGAQYNWISAGADTVLFELDSFDSSDPSADVVQVRCVFEDTGSATLPSEVVTALAGKGLTISTAWASALILEANSTAVDVIISRRTISFSFPP